ncbi:hypothetical protein, partial [Sphingomonas bacterium]|uniref:hypothetical protein n=1 Tax=Sphingomonas bacterium TaxID=1895847 RepID=UPI001C2D9D60
MKDRLVGLAIWVAAISSAWLVITLVLARAAAWSGWVSGHLHTGMDAASSETLFNLFLFGPLIALAIGAAALDRRNALAPGTRPLAWAGVGLLIGLAGLGASALDALL